MQIWLGGRPNQTAIARSFMNKVKIQDLEKVLEPLFYHWKRRRQSKESFGDYTIRMVSSKATKILYFTVSRATCAKLADCLKLV